MPMQVYSYLLMSCNVMQQAHLHSIYILTLSSLAVGTFDSFLAVLGRNRVYGAYCSFQMTHKLVYISSVKQKPGAKSLLSKYTYTVKHL